MPLLAAMAAIVIVCWLVVWAMDEWQDYRNRKDKDNNN